MEVESVDEPKYSPNLCCCQWSKAKTSYESCTHLLKVSKSRGLRPRASSMSLITCCPTCPEILMEPHRRSPDLTRCHDATPHKARRWCESIKQPYQPRWCIHPPCILLHFERNAFSACQSAMRPICSGVRRARRSLRSLSLSPSTSLTSLTV